MNKQVINGKFNSDKSLTLEQNVRISLNENLSTVLHIELAQEYKECVYMIEFDCPNGYSYVTAVLQPTTEQDSAYIEYQLESCILQYVGSVKVQLTVKDSARDNIVAKSTVCSSSVIEVLPSVNASNQSYAKQDLFAQANQIMAQIAENGSELETLNSQVKAVEQSCKNFLTEYQAKLESGALRGDAGATVVSIAESGKDLDGNSIYTISMSDGGQFNFTVPAGKQGEKGDKGDTGLTGEYITTVFFKQTLQNGDREYIIGTNLGNEFSFISPKGTDGIHGETITALNHTSTDTTGNRTYTFITNMGKEFSFVSVKGDKGDQGEKGDTGAKGDKGDTGDVNSVGTYPQLTAGKALADGNGNEISTTYANKNTIINDNILINSNFKINQRGKSSYTVTSDYTVDRWRIGDGGGLTVTPNTNGVAVKNNTSVAKYLQQPLEIGYNIYLGKTYTLSAKINGEVKSATFTMPSALDYADFKVGDFAQVATYSQSFPNSAFLEFIIPASQTYQIEWAKLEENNYATKYSQPDMTLEMLRCQRYYRVSTKSQSKAVAIGGVLGHHQARFCYALPNMRQTPTVTYNNLYVFNYVTNADINITDISVNNYDGQQIVLSVTLDSNASVGEMVQLTTSSTAQGQMIFDAEI